MAEVFFYHLERMTLDQVLPRLLLKALANNWRSEVRTDSKEHQEHLDQWLWTFQDDSFLPHIVSGAITDSHAPVVLTLEGQKDTPSDIIFLLQGCSHELQGKFTRYIYIFSGGDERAVQAARNTWKQAVSLDHEVSYWRQNVRGQWEKQSGKK